MQALVPFNVARHPPQWRKRAASAGQPPTLPLDEATLFKVAGFLQAHGGAAPLGRVTTVFSGTKKAQLAAHFAVGGGEPGGDPLVRLDPSSELATMAIPYEEPISVRAASEMTATGLVDGGGKKKRVRKEKDPDAPAPLPLTPEAVHQIVDYLQAFGGCAPLGRLTTKFEGVKKVQLEAHFHIYSTEGSDGGDFTVSLLEDRSDGQHLVHTQVHSFRADADKGPKKKRMRTRRDPDQAPLPELEVTVLHGIVAFLQAHGGVVSLGKITTEFSGVKKVQLAPHFVLCGLGSTGDYAVCLNEDAAFAAGPTPLSLGAPHMGGRQP